MKCPRCKDKRHVFDAASGLWIPCGCGTGKVARPLDSFGQGFGRFVRQALAADGPSLILGIFPALDEAARAVVAAGKATGRASRLVRLEEARDAAFEREKKVAYFAKLEEIAFVAVVCGDETKHSWNGTVLAQIVAHRTSAGRPTMIATTGDLIALYGEAATSCLKGRKSVPRIRLVPASASEEA